MDDKIALLKKVELFSKLYDMELEIVSQYCQYRSFNDNEIIFKEGSSSNSLYIVKKGEVRIIKRTEDGEERDIAHFIKGESFGELDFFENIPRNVDALAETETVLLSFPAQDINFTDILSKHPQIWARILHKLIILVAGRIRYTNKLVSEKAPWVDDLRHQILYDKLTGLYTRTFLEDDFRVQLPLYGEYTSLLFIKPDNFKVVNDGYGHAAGDKTLRLLADKIKSELSSQDIVVRYRGDEFVAILPNQNKTKAVKTAEQLITAIKNIDLQDVIGEKKFHLTASIGYSTYPSHSEEATELIKKSYAKMLFARNSGGNKIGTRC